MEFPVNFILPISPIQSLQKIEILFFEMLIGKSQQKKEDVH
jgi:hypothetical protein